MSKIRNSNLVKDTLVYTLFNSATTLVPIILMPVLTRFLSPTDYGLMALFSIIVFLAGPIVRLETHASLRRNFFSLNRADFSQQLGVALTLSTAITLVLLTSSLLWSITRGMFFDLPGPWLVAAIIVAYGGCINTHLFNLYQVQGLSWRLGSRSLLLAICTFVPTVILVAQFGFDWRGRTLTQLGVSLLIEIPTSIFLIYKMFPFKVILDPAVIRKLLTFSLPLVPASLAGYLIMTSDRLFLSHYVSLEEVGLFTVAVQIVSVIRLGINSFITSWEVWLFRNMTSGDSTFRRRVVVLLYLFLAGTGACALALTFLAPIAIPWLVGEKYHPSVIFIGWLAAAEIFKTAAACLHTFFLQLERTRTINHLVIFHSGVHIALCFLLIPKFGAIGAAYATFLAALVGFAANLALLNIAYKLPWLSFWRQKR